MIDLLASVGEIAAIRQGRIRASLVLRSARVRPERLRPLTRRVILHDADGNPIGIARQVVEETTPGGERRAIVLTVLAVDDVDVFAGEGPGALTLTVARACGYRTVSGLRDAWRRAHPRSPLARLVWFELGDVRDRPLFLNWSGRILKSGDYTQSRHQAIDDAEVLTRAQLTALAALNGQKDARRRADTARQLERESLAQRVARIESAGAGLVAEVRQELRIIGQRVQRAERKLVS